MVKVINIDTETRTIHISNADGDIKTWRTTESGSHFPIRKGESTKEALDKFVGSKESGEKPNTEYNTEKAVTSLKSELESVFNNGSMWGSRYPLEFQTQDSGNKVVLSIRDLGKWEVGANDMNDPDYDDEDFSDWDWQIPTVETKEKVEKIIKQIREKTGVPVEYSYGEKNWMYFYIPKQSK